MTKATVYWLTGLSGSGKSTIANLFRREVEKEGKTACILDGDDIRGNKHQHLDFSVRSIKENNRLIAKLCRHELRNYNYIVVSVISPFEQSRQQSRRDVGDSYVEVYVMASLDAVIRRDPKGLYKKTLTGQIENFIGVSPNVPYEMPKSPKIILDTESCTIEECVLQLIHWA